MVVRSYSMAVFLAFLTGCSGYGRIKDKGILVEPGWVVERMADPATVLLHVGTREFYDSIHIPGARYIHPYWFSPDTDSLWNELPELDSVVSILSERGVDEHSEIVLYAESEDFASWTARVFMTLDYAGLGDHVHVLNGGFDIWVQEGLETTDVLPETKSKPRWVARPHQVVIKAMDVALNRHNPAYMVVDARSEDSYFGTPDEPGGDPGVGHIEGAYSLPTSKVVSDSSRTRFRSPEDVVSEFNRIGMEPDRTTVFYCGSGVRASVDYLVARHLGYRALVYDGSFQEWEKLGWAVTGPVPVKDVDQ